MKVAAVATGLVLGAIGGRASAQDALSVEVNPLRVELKLGAGATHTQAVTLRNEGENAIRIHARVDDWYLSKDGTPQFAFAKPDTPYSATAWIRLNPVEQVVGPGVTATVRFTVTVPKDVADGGYRSAVMFEFDPPGADPAARARDVVFRGRVATVLYATVGKPVPRLELIDLQVRSVKDRPPVVVPTLQNLGKVHVRTSGTVIVYRPDGSVARELPLPNVPVLPESERDVAIPVWDGENLPPLPPGSYRVEVRIDVGMPAVLVGETVLEIASR
ncbi:MAG: hypothetical protein AB1806_14300 [Acidobacteriota bacterium]